jgi:adenylate cyclase
MASFPLASGALGCAVSIQRAIDARTSEAGEFPLRVRIGLNAGEPVAEDQDLFGTEVQLAARICAQAQPGQILASNVVRELAAGKEFYFGAQRDVALKGFEHPVPLCEVTWRQGEAGKVPQVTPDPSVSLTARETEVLGLLASGRSGKEIATELSVSLSTVQRHIANIYAKIGVRGRVEAAAYAIERRLVRPRND